MHICLPDTREVRPQHGGAYLLYNVHIDGLYHCSLRFKQLLHLHQALAKKFSGPYHQLLPFPPKKLLPLSAAQIEERRLQIEKYLQNISQDKTICNSSIFNLFLLEAQRESTRIRESQVHLDIELVNGQKISLQIVTHDSTDAVLTAVCRALGLNDRYHAYFCLCLCGYDVIRDKLIIKRRLSFFESPYVTLQMAIQQQEQLQNVLSTATSTYQSPPAPPPPATTTTSGYSGNNNNCRCQSCSTQQLQSNINSNSATTGVPLIGSSSGSYNVNDNNQFSGHYNNNNNYTNNNNYYHQYHHGNHQVSLTNCYQNGGSNGDWQPSSIATTSSTTSSSSTFVTHRILLRKSYWDPIYDTHILNDQQALNLLFIQTVYDIKHSLMFVHKEIYHKLESLLASDSKLEYILLARTLKYYNYVHFEPCLSDYPKPRTKVMISIGSKELNMRVLNSPKSLSEAPAASVTSLAATSNGATTSQQQQSPQPLANNNINNNMKTNTITNQQQQQAGVSNSEQILYCTSALVPNGYQHLITKDDLVKEEYNFKVPLIRCWRLTSLETLNSNSSGPAVSLENGKRKSLSLFNSVLGNSNNNNDTNENNQRHHHQTLLSSGNGGLSLIAALTGSTNNAFRRQQATTTNIPHLNHNLYHSHPHQADDQQHIDQSQFSQYELSFEYLISKDTLKWITISSDQAIFISISLQGVVDELVSKRDGRLLLYKGMAEQVTPNVHRRGNNNYVSQQNGQSFTYMYRDGAQKILNTNNQHLIDKFGTTFGYSPTNPSALALARQRQQVRASAILSSASRLSSLATSVSESSSSGQQTAFEISSFKKAPSPIINDAFEGVTNDDDLGNADD